MVTVLRACIARWQLRLLQCLRCVCTQPMLVSLGVPCSAVNWDHHAEVAFPYIQDGTNFAKYSVPGDLLRLVQKQVNAGRVFFRWIVHCVPVQKFRRSLPLCTCWLTLGHVVIFNKGGHGKGLAWTQVEHCNPVPRG